MKAIRKILLSLTIIFATSFGYVAGAHVFVLVLLCGRLIDLFLTHLYSASLASSAPGWGLRRFAEFCFSKKTYTQVLEPALSDMFKEYCDALDAGRPWKARMVRARGYWAFWSAVAAQLPISVLRRIYEVWKSTKAGG